MEKSQGLAKVISKDFWMTLHTHLAIENGDDISFNTKIECSYHVFLCQVDASLQTLSGERVERFQNIRKLS